MRFPGLALLFLFFASAIAVNAAPQTAPAAQGNQQSASANGVDSIIALVQANMSEGLVLKTIQRQNKAYDLTPDDLLKLQKAGVSERIINAMLDPSTISNANPTPAAAPPPAAAPSPATAPSAAPAAPRAASAPGASSLVSSGPTGPGAASGAPGSGAAAKGGSASANAAAGCPQTSSTATPASGTAAAAPSQPAPKSGVFSSFKDRLKGSAQKTVDGFGDTMNCAVDKGVQTSESQVSSVANSAAATPGQAVSNATSTATSTATKPVTTATTNANNSVSTAQTAAKKSATSATK
jgi:hypothetical protein